MFIPILTSDLVARIVRAENAVTLARVQSVRKMPHNPLAVELRQFDHILATLMRNHPEGWWNRVGGLAAEDAGTLAEILDWYRLSDLQPSFEIVPPQSSIDLLHALDHKGFFQSGFRSVLYGTPEIAQPVWPRGISVREVKGSADIFVGLAFDTGFIPAGDARLWGEVAQREFEQGRCYIASVDGVAAAHATLFVREGVAVLGFGATLERFRGRGCQGALLRTRIADAAKADCDLVIVQTNPGSASQRNVERAGLRVAYTKAIWTSRG
jgi:hypothetical protein